MGLTIGQAPALLGAQGVSSVRPTSFFDAGARDRTRSSSQTESSNALSLLGQRESESPRVGLGPGTLSGPGAALNALQRTVRQVRETQPTIQEINIGFQQNAAVERAFQREQREQEFRSEVSEIDRGILGSREASGNRVEFRIPEPAAQARNFINSLNDAAGAAQARFAESSEPAPASGPSFQANGVRIEISNRPGSLLNLTA